jgi:hypothetical protein
MNRDTPLTEVIQHLSKRAAANLDRYPNTVQIAVLESVRSSIAHWERLDIQLDPVAFEAVVSTLVAALASAYHQVALTTAELFNARTGLTIAENLLREMCPELVGGSEPSGG